MSSTPPSGSVSRHGPREMLQLRRIVRRSASLAGLMPLSQDEETARVQQLAAHKQEQAKLFKCELDMPQFETKGGCYDNKVVVELRQENGIQIRYIVNFLDAESGSSHGPNIHSPLYRKPFVLDTPGVYVVRAVSFRDLGLVSQRSLTASAQFVVRPGLSGKFLRSLPSQMVTGVLSIASGAERRITSSLNSLRTAIAQAANATQDAVHVQLGKKQDNGNAAVEFSIEVNHGMRAQDMTNRLTDPSLVSSVAKVLNVDATCVTVQARAKALDEVLLSLSWTFPRGRTYGNEPNHACDYLDGSCLVYAEDKLLETVDYRGPQSIHGDRVSAASGWSAGSGDTAAIVHSGDVMSASGGKHALILRLSRLPAKATDCVFTLSAYHSRNLSKFISPSMRIFDAECPEHLLSTYSVAEAGTSSAVVVCSITREGEEWTVRAHCRRGDGTVRDYTPIEAMIAVVQERYANRRRRMPYVRMHRLWQDNRMLPCGTLNGAEDVILPLLDLSFELFRTVMEFV